MGSTNQAHRRVALATPEHQMGSLYRLVRDLLLVQRRFLTFQYQSNATGNRILHQHEL